MALDVKQIRAETPGIDKSVHLAAAGSALMPKPVVDAVIEHTQLEAEIGGYEAQAAKAPELASVYDLIATLIEASSREIAILENATVAWCHAFYALPLRSGDRVLTCEAEYAANYVAFLQRARRDGIVIDVVPSDRDGSLDLAALEDMIDERVALIATTWVPTNGGLVNPAEKIGEIARGRGIPYLLDACQAVGQMPVNVEALGCDFLSATGRKFLRGPRGTGFLYVREKWLETLEPAMIDHFGAPWIAHDRYRLRPDARRFETWENSYALRAGLGAAVAYALSLGLPAIRDRAWALAKGLRERLERIPGCEVRDLGKDPCAIVSFTIEGLETKEAIARLRKQAITIGSSQPSSTRLDSEARNLPVLFRASPHYYNTEEELDRLVAALLACLDP
ncbi:MAG: aminotransferase class V-fold PLP-dependent enzyme [Kiloniellales bacterium]|nr:aminotransferase class V-fold PLP-dependent enzyme [Kiloniellales bacterium]